MPRSSTSRCPRSRLTSRRRSPTCGGSSDLLARNRWTLVATILGSSLTFIDATVVNVALPALQADLQATITDVRGVIRSAGTQPLDPRGHHPGVELDVHRCHGRQRRAARAPG